MCYWGHKIWLNRVILIGEKVIQIQYWNRTRIFLLVIKMCSNKLATITKYKGTKILYQKGHLTQFKAITI